MRPLALLAALVLSACCGPEVRALRHDERGKLDECTRYVVLATVLEGPRDIGVGHGGQSIAPTVSALAAGPDPVTGLVADDLGDAPWVFVTPGGAAAISPEVEAAWRPPTTRGGRIAEVTAEEREPAPPLVRAAILAARAVLDDRGLLPFDRSAPPDARLLVVGVSVSTREVVERERVPRVVLARVAVHGGSVLDGKFVRDLTSVAAVFPEECAPGEPLEDAVAKAVAGLVNRLPD